MGTNKHKYPKGYFQLTVGTEYIVLNGFVFAIKHLLGTCQGQCFYPAGGDLGYLIQKRLTTAKETTDEK